VQIKRGRNRKEAKKQRKDKEGMWEEGRRGERERKRVGGQWGE
jgi:hypothetical protein